MSEAYRSPLDGVRVLFVEDDEDTRVLFTFVLENAGATVTAVASADEALAALKRERPHVLASDTMLRDEDGWTFIEKIRAMAPEEGGRIPAVAVTGRASPSDKEQSLASGFNVHLSKPVSPAKLVATIAQLADRQQRVAEA